MKSYCLLIADESDGEVDFDLPGNTLPYTGANAGSYLNEMFYLALDNGEMISKFLFNALALSYIEVSHDYE